jgi:hypothetical protein
MAGCKHFVLDYLEQRILVRRDGIVAGLPPIKEVRRPLFGSKMTVPKRRRNEAPSWAAGSGKSAIPPHALAGFTIK